MTIKLHDKSNPYLMLIYLKQKTMCGVTSVSLGYKGGDVRWHKDKNSFSFCGTLGRLQNTQMKWNKSVKIIKTAQKNK